MKYRLEKEWMPNDSEDFPSSRQKNREIKKILARIKNKSTPFFKWIWNKNLSEDQKNKFLNNYNYGLSNVERILVSDSMLYVLSREGIINEAEERTLKRKWIISKLIRK